MDLPVLRGPPRLVRVETRSRCLRGRPFECEARGIFRLKKGRRLSRRGAAHLADQVASRLPGSPWRRILHISDLHNLPSGFRFAKALSLAIRPSMVVNTGDISGWGPAVETFLAWRYLSFDVPHVFAPGNHDSRTCSRRIEGAGGVVLEEPGVREVQGLSFWGIRDPNRTHLFGKPYDPGLCREAAMQNPPPAGMPLVVAVHNDLMLSATGTQIPLVLSGHFHASRVKTESDPSALGESRVRVSVRSGSLGGGGPTRKLPLEAAVIDLASQT
ncbi:MAG TPA: metallophosphoesterase, partial [Actinomycetota bacterium]|nr:metallophosphoesterase [Actinomycetota bacterium]